MANYERGVYEPTDEVRVYDGSEEDEDEAEGSRLPLLIVLAMIVIGAFAGVVYYAYSQGVARGRGETPVLAAPAGPDKIAAQSPGGSDVPYQGFKIYEQPAPPDDQAEAAAETPAAPAPQMAQAVPAPAKPAQPAEKPAAMTPPPAAKPAAPPAPQVATGAPRPLGRALPAPAAAMAPPPARPAPTPIPAPAATQAAAPAGAYVLQIGAYKSQAEADAAWKSYQTRHAALLEGFSQNVQQADLGAKGVWYRLRVAGFSSRDSAVSLCDRLKADGGACFLGR